MRTGSGRRTVSAAGHSTFRGRSFLTCTGRTAARRPARRDGRRSEETAHVDPSCDPVILNIEISTSVNSNFQRNKKLGRDPRNQGVRNSSSAKAVSGQCRRKVTHRRTGRAAVTRDFLQSRHASCHTRAQDRKLADQQGDVCLSDRTCCWSPGLTAVAHPVPWWLPGSTPAPPQRRDLTEEPGTTSRIRSAGLSPPSERSGRRGAEVERLFSAGQKHLDNVVELVPAVAVNCHLGLINYSGPSITLIVPTMADRRCPQ